MVYAVCCHQVVVWPCYRYSPKWGNSEVKLLPNLPVNKVHAPGVERESQVDGGPFGWLQTGEWDRTMGCVNETNCHLVGSRTAGLWRQTCRERWRRLFRITVHDGSAEPIGNVRIKSTCSCTVIWKYIERRNVHRTQKYSKWRWYYTSKLN
jgi:hypothetical protein